MLVLYAAGPSSGLARTARPLLILVHRRPQDVTASTDLTYSYWVNANIEIRESVLDNNIGFHC